MAKRCGISFWIATACLSLLPAVAWAAPIHAADPLESESPVAQTLRDPIRHVSVRTVVRARVSADDMAAIRDEVEKIWSPYGVRVSWDAPPEEEEGTPLRILFDDRGSAFRARRRASDPAIAAVQFLEPGVPRDVVFVSPSGARGLHDEAVRRGYRSVDRGRATARIMGRAIAHELGHFLLAKSNHDPTGLMRAKFGVEDAAAAVGDRFRLDPATVALLRHVNAVLLARQQGSPGPERATG